LLSITCIANDLPLLQLLQIPELRNFTIYYWHKVIIKKDQYRFVKYNAKYHLGDLNHTIEKIIDNYTKLNKTEIWTEDGINSTLRQIKYCNENGFFSTKEDKDRVCNSLIYHLRNIENILENNYREHKINFFVSSVGIGTNSFILEFLDQKIGYLNFNIMNLIATSNEKFTQEILEMRRSIIGKSINISGQSDLTRRNFFKAMKNSAKELLN